MLIGNNIYITVPVRYGVVKKAWDTAVNDDKLMFVFPNIATAQIFASGGDAYPCDYDDMDSPDLKYSNIENPAWIMVGGTIRTLPLATDFRLLRRTDGMVMPIFKECYTKDYLKKSDAYEFTQVKNDQRVCINRLAGAIKYYCKGPYWMNPTQLIDFVYSTLYITDYHPTTPQKGEALVAPAVYTNCTFLDFIAMSNCFLTVALNDTFSFSGSELCVSVHENKHNWFTSLMLAMFHAILDPLVELLFSAIEYLNQLFVYTFQRLTRDVRLIGALAGVNILRYYTGSWSFALPVFALILSCYHLVFE